MQCTPSRCEVPRDWSRQQRLCEAFTQCDSPLKSTFSIQSLFLYEIVLSDASSEVVHHAACTSVTYFWAFVIWKTNLEAWCQNINTVFGLLHSCVGAFVQDYTFCPGILVFSNVRVVESF